MCTDCPKHLLNASKEPLHRLNRQVECNRFGTSALPAKGGRCAGRVTLSLPVFLTSVPPHVHLLLSKAVSRSDDPARGDDGAATQVFPSPLHADLPDPLVPDGQRAPDDTSAITEQSWAGCKCDMNKKGMQNHWWELPMYISVNTDGWIQQKCISLIQCTGNGDIGPKPFAWWGLWPCLPHSRWMYCVITFYWRQRSRE